MRYLDPPEIREKRDKVQPYLIRHNLEVSFKPGTPEYIKKLDAEVRAFWKKRDELEMKLMGAPE